MSIRAENLYCQIGGKDILHDLTLGFEPGQVSVIVGPNGSGKSTLLGALTGTLPAYGTIRLNDFSVAPSQAPLLAPQRAVLTQYTQVAFNFQVQEIVQMGLRSGPHASQPEIVGHALNAVGLAEFADRPYQHLSGGEQQRVQLARVLAQVWEPVQDERPSWLILDEPVSSLDIRHQLDVVALARDYAARGGGVLAVMHDLNLTAMMADHVVVMHRGRALQTGPVGRVLNDAVLSRAYGCTLRVGHVPDPPGGERPVFVLPQTAQR